MTHEIREATADDADEIVYLLDAAMLEFDRERVRRRVCDGDCVIEADVLVAVDDGENVIGACVLSIAEHIEGEGIDDGGDVNPIEIESIAVRRSRRGRGIGRALVETAATRAARPLVARFREQVRPFYAALGFEIRRGNCGEAGAGRRNEAEADDPDETDPDGRDETNADGPNEPADDPDDPADDRLCGILR
ncbi:GNAT family N-acetyltransferase [Halobellus captivus]|uniref:GNAT family N-acetyltransferase n=1 Tax=Halobellus captivus TaxID=2592614 RepID=UPI001EEFE626|nr:GNAT family N-acetyltransferase [Halobellus captivus]